MEQLNTFEYTIKEIRFMTTKSGYNRFLLKNGLIDSELEDDSKISLPKDELESYCTPVKTTN